MTFNIIKKAQLNSTSVFKINIYSTNNIESWKNSLVKYYKVAHLNNVIFKTTTFVQLVNKILGHSLVQLKMTILKYKLVCFIMKFTNVPTIMRILSVKY